MLLYRPNQSGFTVIELLLMAILLSILAYGVFTVVNPFEYSRFRRDESGIAATERLKTFLKDYYQQRQTFPWCLSGPRLCTQDPTGVLLSSPLGRQIIRALSDEGTLSKEDETLYLREFGNQIAVTGTVRSGTLILCFRPDSEGLGRDARTQYSPDGTVNEACQTGSEDNQDEPPICWQCFR